MKKNFVRNILLVMVIVMAIFAITGCSNQSESQSAQETIVNKYDGWEVIGIEIDKEYSSISGYFNCFIVAAIDTNGEFNVVDVNQIVIIESGNTYLSAEFSEHGAIITKLFVTKDDYQALS